MGRQESYYIDLVLPKDSLSAFKTLIAGPANQTVFHGFFGESEDFLHVGGYCNPYESGKLPDEEKLPKFYQDFLLEPPEDYETVTVEIVIRGWFAEEGIEGILGFLEKMSNGEALLIVGGSEQSSGRDDDEYEVLFKVKDIKKLKEEKKGKRSKKESATIRCVICNEEDRSVLCLPCRHVATCEKCSKKSPTCPLCKANIEKREEVFLS